MQGYTCRFRGLRVCSHRLPGSWCCARKPACFAPAVGDVALGARAQGRAVSSGDSLGGGQGLLWVLSNLQWLRVARDRKSMGGGRTSQQRLRMNCTLIRDAQTATKPGVRQGKLIRGQPGGLPGPISPGDAGYVSSQRCLSGRFLGLQGSSLTVRQGALATPAHTGFWRPPGESLFP